MFANLLRSRSLHVAALCLLALSPCRAEDPPGTLTRTISTATDSVTVDFTYHPFRSTNFAVLVQGSGGTFTTHTSLAARTYIGTVQGQPGAIASGLIRKDGSLLCRISFENGVEWSSTGGTAAIRGTTGWTPAWPTTVVPPGGAGSIVRAAEVGVDSAYQQYVACGSDVDATVEMAEFCVMAANTVYLRDAAILHRVGKVVIRTDATADPYAPDGTDTTKMLARILSVWNAAGTAMGTTHDLALVAKPGLGGGLAYIGSIGALGRYSASGSDAAGDFSVVWRHEGGHNWGSDHYEGGGRPESGTIMSDNQFSRFSSSELAKIIAQRNAKASVLDNLGAYSFSLPPRANMDRAVFLNATPVMIDLLANDSDSNGDALSLASFPATTALGATLTRSAGTGPGGRDQILYTPGRSIVGETDSFSYQIADAGGRTATGYATVRPVAGALLDHWKLDEASGTAAVNSIRSLNGTHQNGPVAGQAGANPATNLGVYYDGSNDRTSLPSLSYKTDTLTFTAWIKRDGTQYPWAPVFFSRGIAAGSTVAGFGFGDANELRYQWNNSGSSFAPSPALTVPDGQWCLVSMAVSPTGVTLYLRTPAGLQSATHTTTIPLQEFESSSYLGRDTADARRHFKGWMDDVRTYAATLTPEQIESLYQQAGHPPGVTVSAPLAGASVPALDLRLSAEVAAGGYLIGDVEFFENSENFGSVDAPPYALTIPTIHAGPHTVTARATFGDWGYSAPSPPQPFTVLPPPLPVVNVDTSGAPSRLGPVTADFVLTRSHPLGDLTVPFTISGTAESGTDYQPLATSVSFPDGTLTRTVTLTPVAGTPQAIKTVVLALSGTPDFTAGTPAEATLTIDDHITSIVNAAWNVGSTWTNGVAAPVTGTQNSGDDYAVRHVVTSNNTASNTQALIGHGLRIESGGTLDLARLHASTNQNVSYSLPPVTLENGGTIQFRASTGSSTHTIPAALVNKGIGTLRINGGNYSNAAILTGALSGSGRLDLISTTNTGNVVGDLRQLSVNSANNSFTGSWTVNHAAASSDDFAALRAGASRALGSGTVTVGTQARLINDASGGLDSLTGVVMNGLMSRLDLNQRWNQPTASLSLLAGSPEVKLGNAESIIGNLSGTTGLIYGTGSASAFTVQQTTAAVYDGNLGSPLKFTKAGAAALKLDGTIANAVQLALQAGELELGTSPATVASLNQTSGTLLLNLVSVATTPLTVNGNYSRSAGGIVVRSSTVPTTGVAYPILAYKGTMASPPSVTFAGPAGSDLVMSVQPGTGTNSVLTVTFNVADPFAAWVAGFGLTGADALPGADPDQDGLANRAEMLLGFDPTSATSRLILSLKTVGSSSVILNLNRVVKVGAFTLQSATDLAGPWVGTPLSVSVDENDHEIMVEKIGDRRFFRALYTAP